jgi:glycosyltransferase involved in cell wall biosynthesis
MTGSPVSVIIPVYNGERYLRAAIDTVLAQIRAAQQVIVVDDGSVDATPSVLAGLGDAIIVVRQENRGPAAARNAGLNRASAPLVAFLDADDLWFPSSLADQLRSLEEEPGADVAWGLSDRLFMSDASRDGDDWHGRPQWSMTLGSMLFRKTRIEAIGGFDETLGAGEDFDLIVRMREAGVQITRHADVVHKIRIHGTSHFSTDAEAIADAHFRVVARALARRRAAAQDTDRR